MKDTITSSEEITRLFNEGKRYYSPEVTIIVSKAGNQHGHSGRVAFIAGKKQGNAVWRNTAKRRMRAICRDIGGPWPKLLVIFMAKRKITSVSYSKVSSDCKKMIQRIQKDFCIDDGNY